MNIQSPDSNALQKEVFHRVSNNFQIIQSMIRLVSRDGSITDKAKEMEVRIQMLSIAHHALHSLEDAQLFPIATALPNLVTGVQRGGFLSGREVVCDVKVGAMSVQRTYALLHLVIEAIRTLDRSSATKIVVRLDAKGLAITSDASHLEVNETTRKLAAAFARDFGQDPVWAPDGLSVAFD